MTKRFGNNGRSGLDAIYKDVQNLVVGRMLYEEVRKIDSNQSPSPPAQLIL